MKKFAVFSDVHSNAEALEAILKDIEQNPVDEVICLGDVIAIGPNPKECLDLIIRNNIRLLLGNHELYFLKGTNIGDEMSEGQKEHQNWVASQLSGDYKNKLQNNELKYEIEYSNTKIIFFHFFYNQNNDEIYPFKSLDILKDNEVNNVIKTMNYDFIFYGHEHYGKDIFIDNKKCINVKTAGCTKNNITSYLVLEIEENNSLNIIRKNIIYDREKFEKKMKETYYPEKAIINNIFFGVEI